MKRLYNYNDFLFDLIFESKGVSLPIKLSDRLIILLKRINCSISIKLLQMNKEWTHRDVTFIDYDDNNINNFTYSLSSKIYDIISKEQDTTDIDKIIKRQDYYARTSVNIWNKYRTSSRIGRFINRILPGTDEKDIENFVNQVKLKRTQQFENFKIVEGDELLKYYLQSSYSKENGTSNVLHNSCMRYDKCQDYIRFYIDNNIKMVVLMSDLDKDKILGRSILWKLDEPTDRYFMDRVYYVNDYDVENFKDYAKKNNWLYKNNQSRDPNDLICDPLTDNCERMTLVVKNIKYDKYFAYLDTLSYYYPKENILTNNSNFIKNGDQPYYLQSTDGGYTIGNMRYMEYYGRLVEIGDLVWCQLGRAYRLRDDAVYIDYNDEYATQEYADENLIFSEFMDKYLNKNDSDVIYLDNYDTYVTEDYASNFLKYCNELNKWLLEDDAVHSNFYKDYLERYNSIKVIVGFTRLKSWKFDWRKKEIKTYKEFKYKDQTIYYDEDLINIEEIKKSLNEKS
jgi:hypothetical protein